ncbi:MAG: DUF4097 family beta strand repeat-containing protein [Chloroflexota bacterium]
MDDLSDRIAKEVEKTIKSVKGLNLEHLGDEIEAAFSGAEGAGGAGETEDRDFAVGPHAGLNLTGISGSVEIRPGPPGAIHIQATKHGSGAAIANTVVDMRQSGDRVIVSTRQESQGLKNLLRGSLASVHFQIELPPDTSVEVKVVSADVSSSDLSGPITLTTVSGDLSLGRLSGQCQLNTVSGDVNASELSGRLIFRSTSGDVTLRDSTLPDANMSSVSGDFTMATPLNPQGQYIFHTTSGDLTLYVPAETGASVQMKAVSGDVHVSDLPTTVIKSGRRRWQGRIGGGGAAVEMSSVSGDLHISLDETGVQSRENPETAGAPASRDEQQHAPPPAERAESTEILEALARGDITVEEAMSRLDSLA